MTRIKVKSAEKLRAMKPSLFYKVLSRPEYNLYQFATFLHAVAGCMDAAMFGLGLKAVWFDIDNLRELFIYDSLQAYHGQRQLDFDRVSRLD